MLNRTARKSLGEGTVAILKAGSYKSSTGKTVSLEEQLRNCIAGTRVIGADESLPHPSKDKPATAEGGATSRIVEVTHESTLEACQRLCEKYRDSATGTAPRVMALNFASAHNPGGGFLGGSQAQEESLARNSTLYASQTAHPGMYNFNDKIKRGDPTAPHTIYSDTMLYSPDVVVFRDEHDGHLLDNPYPITVISAPAPNAGATYTNFGRKAGVSLEKLTTLVNDALRRRLERVLALSAQEGLDYLVLGAYGCGVFKNDVGTVINVYKSLLFNDGPFAGTFRHVVFAIYGSETDKTYLRFKETF